MNTQTYSFPQQYEKQKQYFDAFVNWLENRTNILRVSVSHLHEDINGIDLWVDTVDRNYIAVQVKVDFRVFDTGNMAAEVVSQATENREGRQNWRDWKEGWVAHLPAVDYLAYIDGRSGRIRIYNAMKLYQFIIDHYAEFPNFSARNSTEDGKHVWYGLGVLVPLIRLEQWNLTNGNIYLISPMMQLNL